MSMNGMMPASRKKRTARGPRGEEVCTTLRSRLRSVQQVTHRHLTPRQNRTGNEDARRIVFQVRRAAVWPVNEGGDPTSAVPGSILPQAPSKSATTSDQEHDFFLAITIGTIQRPWNARNRERMCLGGEITDGRKEHIRVLSRTPVHVPAEGQADGVGGNKLNDRGTMLVRGPTFAPVSPYQPGGSEHAVEGPND